MPIIQLQPHLFTSLPRHPDLQGEADTPDLQDFIRAILDEARPLLNQFPSTLKADRRLHSSGPSKAKVKLSRGWRTLAAPQQDAMSTREFWVCRQSEHQDSNHVDGTISWWEMHDGLRDNHAEHEMEYTPSVTSVHQLLNWNESPQWNPNKPIILADRSYKHFNVELNLIVHTFHPRALIRPRAFISWTMSATFCNAFSTTRSDLGSDEPPQPAEGFITIQVPFYLTKPIAPESQYERLYAKIMDAVPPRTVFAYYASVERVELVVPSAPPGSANPSSLADSNVSATPPSRCIRWIMLTTSEAGGKIPKWVQRSWTLGGVPRAVVADVGLFIQWTMKRREERRLEEDAQVEEV